MLTIQDKKETIKAYLKEDFSREEVKRYRSNPNKYWTALSKGSKKQLSAEEEMWVKDKLREKGKSPFIVFANWKWKDIKEVISA